jgi:hypothetical protein
MKDPECAYCYARYIIGGRWTEAEQYIMKDPEFAYYYVINVIKGRWIEAEPYIINTKYHSVYIKNIHHY